MKKNPEVLALIKRLAEQGLKSKQIAEKVKEEL